MEVSLYWACERGNIHAHLRWSIENRMKSLSFVMPLRSIIPPALNDELFLPEMYSNWVIQWSIENRVIFFVFKPFWLSPYLAWPYSIIYVPKISKNITIIVKLKHYVWKATFIGVYYSLIYPYVTYTFILWGNNYQAPFKL